MRKRARSLHIFPRLRETPKPFYRSLQITAFLTGRAREALAGPCPGRIQSRIMPLLYRSEYFQTEIAPRPLELRGASAAELGQNFDRAINKLYKNIRAHFAQRNAAVVYDPVRQQIELSYRIDDTEPGCYFQFQATIEALVNRDNFENIQAPGTTEVYPVVSVAVKRILQGYWTVFDNTDRLHERLAEEIRGLLPTGPTPA